MLGQGRDWVIELAASDPIPHLWSGASVDAEGDLLVGGPSHRQHESADAHAARAEYCPAGVLVARLLDVRLRSGGGVRPDGHGAHGSFDALLGAALEVDGERALRIALVSG